MHALRTITPWRAVAAIALVVAAPLAFAQSISGEVKQRVLDRLTTVVTTSAFVPGEDFSRLPKLLAEQKEAIAKAETHEQFRDAINEVLIKFGKSHLALITPSQTRQRREGKTVGLGVSIKIEDDGLLIVRVVPKSAAFDAKLQPGDKIVEANGKPVKDPSELAGSEGESVSLKLKTREGSERLVTIVRKAFSTVRKEELTWLNPETAVLKVHTFDLSYDHDNVEDLMKEAAKAKRLVVDLRDNGGGVVWNVQHFLGLFLPASTPIGTFVKKSTVERFVEETQGKKDDLKAIAEWSTDKMRAFRNDLPRYKGRLAVLVNANTGSGAEIAAAAMREELTAPVVGTKSAGAVLVALMQGLPEGYTLLYPLMDYVTIRGQRLEGIGVAPDVEAKEPGPLVSASLEDEGIAKALDLLAKSAGSAGH